MRKSIYIFILLIVGFYGCVNNDDESDPIITPITIDEILGTWEVYYSTKQVVVSYINGTVVRPPEFRSVYYDGFTTTFWKEGNQYKFRSNNATGGVIEEGTFKMTEVKNSLENDYLLSFYYKSPNTGKDTVTENTYIKTGRTNIKEGRIKLNIPAYKYFNDQTIKYTVYEYRSIRNTKTAPNYNADITPKKTEVDFSKLIGKWEIYNYEYRQNGFVNTAETNKRLAFYKGSWYKFYNNKNGEKRADVRTRDSLGRWTLTERLPVYLVDDIVYILPKSDKKISLAQEQAFEQLKMLKIPATKNKLKSILRTDDTKQEEVPAGLFMWITDWNNNWVIDGAKKEAFIDNSQGRDPDNINIVINSKIFFKRTE